jgi:hypothetical protein
MSKNFERGRQPPVDRLKPRNQMLADIARSEAWDNGNRAAGRHTVGHHEHQISSHALVRRIGLRRASVSVLSRL